MYIIASRKGEQEKEGTHARNKTHAHTQSVSQILSLFSVRYFLSFLSLPPLDSDMTGRNAMERMEELSTKNEHTHTEDDATKQQQQHTVMIGFLYTRVSLIKGQQFLHLIFDCKNVCVC